VVCCYWTASSDRLSDIGGPSLPDCAVAMAEPLVATSRTTAMGELTSSTHFSPNHIQEHILLNITQMYNNMTMTEVDTPIYI
jgi:hypothetical protein